MKMQGCQQAKHLVWHQPTGVQCQATRLSVTRAAEAPTSGLSSQEHKTTQQAQATDATVASAAQVLDMAVGHQCPPLLRPQLCKERAAQPTWRMGNAAAGHCCLGFSQLGLKRSGHGPAPLATAAAEWHPGPQPLPTWPSAQLWPAAVHTSSAEERVAKPSNKALCTTKRCMGQHHQGAEERPAERLKRTFSQAGEQLVHSPCAAWKDVPAPF